MSKFPFAVFRLPARAACMLLAASLGACASMPPAPSLPVNGLTLLDDFHMVRGMAEGAVFSPGVSPATVTTMTRLDLEAGEALLKFEQSPGSSAARTDAQAAIQRFSTYAAHVSAPGAAPMAASGGQS